jgi:hypothetical protein
VKTLGLRIDECRLLIVEVLLQAAQPRHEVEELVFGYRLIEAHGHEAGGEGGVAGDGLMRDIFFLASDVEDE